MFEEWVEEVEVEVLKLEWKGELVCFVKGLVIMVDWIDGFLMFVIVVLKVIVFNSWLFEIFGSVVGNLM